MLEEVQPRCPPATPGRRAKGLHTWIEKLNLEISVNDTIRSSPELINSRFAVGNLPFALGLLYFEPNLDMCQVYCPITVILSVLD